MIIFVINLDRATERWAEIKKQAQVVLPSTMQLVRISATDGNDGIPWDVTSKRTELRIKQKQSATEHWIIDSPQAVACTLSHMKCWSTLLRDYPGHESCIILEDDVLFNQSIPDIAANIRDIPNVWLGGYDMLLLGISWQPMGSQKPKQTTYTRGVCSITDFVGSHGYCVTQHAASTLLRHALPIEQHVDFYIGTIAQLGLLRLGVMCPELVRVNHNVPLYIPHKASMVQNQWFTTIIIAALCVVVVVLLILIVLLLPARQLQRVR
jgi:GR25 family glycosyltransferase involved in LPS biosynthesis